MSFRSGAAEDIHQTCRASAASIISAILAASVWTADSAAQTAPADPRPRNYALLDQRAPEFALEKLGGGVARLNDYRGSAGAIGPWLSSPRVFAPSILPCPVRVFHNAFLTPCRNLVRIKPKQHFNDA